MDIMEKFKIIGPLSPHSGNLTTAERIRKKKMSGKSLKDDDSSSGNQSSPIVKTYHLYCIKHQQMLDRATPYTGTRWLFWVLVATLYLLRVFFLQGWYIVTYAIGIYLLNQFIAFLTPKIDPAMQDYEEDGLSLSTKSSEEFRPFMRQLAELKFWYRTLRSIVIGLVCTCFDFFNVPVFWPILVLYIITLFVVTMKKQIRHMIKFKYIPFTHSLEKMEGLVEKFNHLCDVNNEWISSKQAELNSKDFKNSLLNELRIQKVMIALSNYMNAECLAFIDTINEREYLFKLSAGAHIFVFTLRNVYDMIKRRTLRTNSKMFIPDKTDLCNYRFLMDDLKMFTGTYNKNDNNSCCRGTHRSRSRSASVSDGRRERRRRASSETGRSRSAGGISCRNISGTEIKKKPITKINYYKIKLASTTNEYIEAASLFTSSIVKRSDTLGGIYSSFKVVYIHKVVNKKLSLLYNAMYEQIGLVTNGLVNERKLYHGSENLDDIIQKGFDLSKASSSGTFGKGLYFSANSSVSNKYVFSRQSLGCAAHNSKSCYVCARRILVCKVLLGNAFKPKSSNHTTKEPPMGHHSVQGKTGKNGTEFVVYNAHQVLPYLVIGYQLIQ